VNKRLAFCGAISYIICIGGASYRSAGLFSPDPIRSHIMMKRRFFVAIAVFTAIFSFAGAGTVFAQTPATGKFTAEQYKKALWMVTRFYGAQRSGVGPNWLLMDHTYKASFIKDADGTYNLEGGWFDCGDHVLFGQTFFYSAYMLAAGYDAFPTGFYDLYHGKDYSDYAASGKWSIDGGSPNSIPDLLEELKYATDWIIKATPNNTTFYSQKGDGAADHKNWVTSGFMSTLTKEQGGESNGPRSIVKNPNDRPMASFAAATLAVMSRIYRKYDSDYADECLAHARNAYAYAKSKGANAAVGADGGFYPAMSGNKVPLVFHIAAAEMYKTTKESTFLNDMRTEQVNFHNWGFDYDNPHDIAAYASAATFTENKQSYLDNIRTEFLNKYTDPSKINSEGVNTWGNEWGAMRYVSNHAFTAALYSKLANTSQYDQFIYNQVDYILGKNSRNYSFLVGFDEHGGQAAQKPHHRNVYLDDRNVEVKNTLSIPPRNKYFGYMVGGHRDPNRYEDNVDTYESTEGGLDYQAGLVGVLAYIVSKLAPADTSAFGKPLTSAPVPKAVQISLAGNALAYSDTLVLTPSESRTLYAHFTDESGAHISSSDIDCDNVTWKLNDKNDIWKTGCSVSYSAENDTATKITVSYPVAGPGYISGSISVKITTSVSYISASLSKHGYAMTVKPQSVTFTAAAGREITALGIYNIQGKRVFAASGNRKEITWSRAASPRGMYLIKLTMNNGAVVQRNLILK